MQKSFMKIIVLTICLMVVAPFATYANNNVDSPSWYPKLKYVALGDSLAFGFNEHSEVGNSYVDFIGQFLNEVHLLEAYSKGYAFPGFTTTDVLSRLEKNSRRLDELGVNEQALPVKTMDAVAIADIVTISAGANDILPYITQSGSDITIDEQEFTVALQTVRQNYEQIFTQIRLANEDAQIYVMGYYNAFAHAVSGQQAMALLDALNDTIADVAQQYEAVYVDTANAIAQNIEVYLPNPQNIHVSEAGYEQIANEFIQYIGKVQQTTAKKLHVKAINTTTVELQWDEPFNAENVDSYKVYINGELYTQLSKEQRDVTIEQLTPGTRYTFEVRLLDEDNVHEVALGLSNWELTWAEASQFMFTDIRNHPDGAIIDRASRLQIVSGYPNQTYRPAEAVKRVQAVKTIVEMLGIKAQQQAPYEDIAYYAAETQQQIAAAYEAGIIKNVDGAFRPNQYITRAQLALMLMRAYVYTTEQALPQQEITFDDIAYYAVEAQQAIEFMHQQEIISGWQGHFMPQQYASRAHAAKMAVNTFDILLK